MNRNEPLPLDIRLMNRATVLLLVMLGIFAAVAGARWLSSRSVFAVQSIAVLGDVTHTNVPTVRAHVVSRVKGTFFTVDLGQTRTVFEAMPWVRSAVIHRDFPNRLRVNLEEHKAVAFWGAESEPRLLNSFGEVFDANLGEVEQDQLARLSGPGGQGSVVLKTYRLLEPLFSRIDIPLASMELTGKGSWRVVLETGAAIELGRGSSEEIAVRTERFLKTLTQVAVRYARPLSALESADLRHENGYAIRLRGVTTLTDMAAKKQ